MERYHRAVEALRASEENVKEASENHVLALEMHRDALLTIIGDECMFDAATRREARKKLNKVLNRISLMERLQ